ncbi:tetratricopeptide repeat protein 16 isoform X2 [Lemur catta]|uniref:tetratricopeptide repeat protein 16 isoform X2 n=1 Tax=Lemur catta TaxID=9447 RepID=UPI001E267282|nr:tetratricopeptide repeat protein 16 isoform X2 [Lemur catta]
MVPSNSRAVAARACEPRGCWRKPRGLPGRGSWRTLMSYHQGQLCLEQKEWEMAVLFLSRALHLDPQLVEFYALRAKAYIQLCDFSSAAQNLRKAHSIQPENTKYLERLTFVLYLQGQCLFEQCAFLDALTVFSQASELQPEKPCFRYRCMACLLALRRHRDCLSLITKEVRQGTTNADIYILQARLYNFLQKPNLCYRHLHRALLLDPKHPQARVLLGKMVEQAQRARQEAGILAVQGKLQHALQRINCAIENNPLDPSLFLFRGILYRRLQEFDGAVEDLLKALDMLSDSQEDMVQQAQRQLLLAYNDFAVHCYTRGAYQEGVLLLNKALRGEQQEKGLYINRGDCFFQLGHLGFAEADYKQALALSPHDEGANMRMGLLQEKMGLCEQRRRQFQRAEEHFSVAIQHNPQKAQYYLYRAKSRQLLQNIFGARQDVATVLLLNPQQPKLLPLMTNLFPGMSGKEVLGSQMAHLAQLQLQRLVESSQQAGGPQGIVGLLRELELKRQKARALQLSWKQEEPLFETSKELKVKATAQIPPVEPASSEGEAKVPKGKEAEKKEKGPSSCWPCRAMATGASHGLDCPVCFLPQEKKLDKVTSLSDSYLDQTSSGSALGFRTMSTLETETSTTSQEYRSTSATAVTFSDSSLLKTQSSDSGDNREDLPLSHSPRKAKASQGPRQRPSKTETTQGQSRRPRKIKATQSPRQRLRKSRAAHGQNWRSGKADATQGWGLIRSSSKTNTSLDLDWSPRKPEATQGQSQRQRQSQSQRPSEAQTAQSWSQSASSSSNNAESTWGPSPATSKTKTTRSLSQGRSNTRAGQDTGKYYAL